MYIKLNNSNISYDTETNSNFLILSEIVNSKQSFENPVIINSISKLNIWFGKNFEDYNYLVELIGSGISLYLYKPLLLETINETPLDNCLEESKVFYNSELSNYEVNASFNDIIIKSLPEIGNKEMIYKILDDNGNYIEKNINNTILKYNKSIWELDNYVDIRNITSINNSKSFYNRDTLNISDNIVTTPEYEYKDKYDLHYYYYIYSGNKWNFLDVLPTDKKYNYNYQYYNYKSFVSSNILSKEGDILRLNIPYIIDLEKLQKNYTLSWKINWYTINLKNSYLVLYDKYNKLNLLYSGEKTTELNNILNKLECNSINYKNETELKILISNLGYFIKDDYIYSIVPRPINYFSKNIDIQPDKIKTNNLLDYSLENIDIKFWSKVIGESDIESRISISIEKEELNKYKIEVKKYDYTEIFEGSINSTSNLERIDYIISKESKLIDCKIINQNLTSILEGSWDLLGSRSENKYSDSDFNLGLDQLINSMQIPIDFLLIPEKKYYKDSKLLSLSKDNNFQVLIQNSESNYKTNNLDPENRLVYFYNRINYLNSNRPGYYLYLKGLVSNVFSETSNDILYNSPDISIIEELEKYKSNYLMFNGYYYYYKTFFDGINYTTTGWMRFAISKISRELEKNKWEIIGTRLSLGKVESRIKDLFNKIVDNYSIINSINIDYINLNLLENKISLTITTIINDLVKHNLTIDLTINYKTI